MCAARIAINNEADQAVQMCRLVYLVAAPINHKQVTYDVAYIILKHF